MILFNLGKNNNTKVLTQNFLNQPVSNIILKHKFNSKVKLMNEGKFNRIVDQIFL